MRSLKTIITQRCQRQLNNLYLSVIGIFTSLSSKNTTLSTSITSCTVCIRCNIIYTLHSTVCTFCPGGGSGFIGTRLRSRLTAAGYDVTIVSRMPGLKRITWHDLEQKGLPERTHAVINVAGQNVLDPWRRWTPG